MLLPGSAKITSSGLMCRSAITLHKEAGERGQTGWIAALRRKPAEHALDGAMRLSHGCPSGGRNHLFRAMAVVAVQIRSGAQPSAMLLLR